MTDYDSAVDAAEEVASDTGSEDHVEYLESGVGPNFRVAIAPNGYIWASLNVDLISTQFYCDAQVARAMARMLNNAADEHAKILAEIEARELLGQATNVVDLGKVREAKYSMVSDDEGSEEAAAHDAAVEDAIVAEAEKLN